MNARIHFTHGGRRYAIDLEAPLSTVVTLAQALPYGRIEGDSEEPHGFEGDVALRLAVRELRRIGDEAWSR